MLTRSTRLLSLFLLLLATCSLSDAICQKAVAVPVPAPAPTFVITQVQYTDANGKMQTVMVAKGMVQIPAVAVKNQIIIGGTYTPFNPEPMFAGNINVDVLEAV